MDVSNRMMQSQSSINKKSKTSKSLAQAIKAGGDKKS